MLGPIDYIVVGFRGNNFDGSILSALSKATESGVIRVVDLIFVIKDEKGAVAMAELEDQDEELREVARAIGHVDETPLLTEEDVKTVGASMKNDTSAGILVIEQLWAKDLKRALLDHDAEIIDEGRIHPDKVAAAEKELEEV